MEALIVLVIIIKNMAISLGVGGSTLAIINFFVAIADGKIDESERNMMGVVYVVLRVAMITILLTTLLVAIYQYGLIGTGYFTPFVIAEWLLVFMLYGNAILMTMHIMPSTIGPALQASSWYTLGILQSLVLVGLGGFAFGQFVIGYLAVIALAVSLVNGMMAYLKKRRASVPKPTTPAASEDQ